MADSDSCKNKWLTPRDHSNKTHQYRRRSRRELGLESVLQDWYGEDYSSREIENLQRSEQSLASLMEKTIDNLDSGEHRSIRRIWAQWKEIVGVEIAPHTEPRSLNNGVLIVEVFDAGWMFRLQMVQRDLLAKVNAVLEKKKIRALRLVAGGSRPRAGSAPNKRES